VGVKVQGGIVDWVTRELEVECLPSDIPERITVDISNLEIGKHVAWPRSRRRTRSRS
jgi:large subunit ribosomal protein L25